MAQVIASGQRVLRLFLSSTFRDMQAERNILARLVLPRLRQEFATKGAVLEEVDLRWGVTEAMARNAGALAVCLEELATCAPLVLGLVGHRIGWLPPLDAIKVIDQRFSRVLPAGVGITEIELRYALYLAIRDSLGEVPVLLRSDRLSAELAGAENEWEASLAIRRWCTSTAGIHTVEYDTLNMFEQLVEAQVRLLLSTELSHPPHLRPRFRARPEIDRSRDMRRLRWVVGWRRPTLVFAPRGAGTSWILKQWVREDPSGLYVDGRVTGAATLAEALTVREDPVGSTVAGWAVEGPSDCTAITDRRTSELMATLHVRGGPRRIVIDHYEDSFATEAQADLAWFPRCLPWGRSLVVVAHSERLREEARALGWTLQGIPAVARPEALAFAHAYLKAFAKHLSPPQLSALGGAPWLDDLGSLVLALDELRRFGSVDALDQRIAALVACGPGADIAEEVISGLRSVLAVPWCTVVDSALIAMRISLRGLEQNEIRATCGVLAEGVGTGSLPSHLWSAIQIGLGSGLAARGSQLDVASGPLLDWCDRRIRADQSGAARVAAALDRALASAAPARRWQEAPRIAEVIAGQQGLAALLSQPHNILCMLEIGEGFAAGYLDRLTPDLRPRVVEDWLAGLLDADSDAARRLAFLAVQCGEIDGARRLLAMTEHAGEAGRTAWEKCLIAVIMEDRPALQRLACEFSSRPPEESQFGERAMIASVLVSGCADGRIVLSEREERTLMDHAAANVRQISDPLLSAQLKLATGQIALGRARWRDAASQFDVAVGLARGAGNTRLLCRALERLSTVHIERHRFRSARRSALECRELAAKAGLSELEALGFERQIEIERLTANWQSAYNLAERYYRRCCEGIANPRRALNCLESLEALS